MNKGPVAINFRLFRSGQILPLTFQVLLAVHQPRLRQVVALRVVVQDGLG